MQCNIFKVLYFGNTLSVFFMFFAFLMITVNINFQLVSRKNGKSKTLFIYGIYNFLFFTARGSIVSIWLDESGYTWNKKSCYKHNMFLLGNISHGTKWSLWSIRDQRSTDVARRLKRRWHLAVEDKWHFIIVMLTIEAWNWQKTLNI